MRSPFPGMDPYIEASGLWEDFHGKLIGEIERCLATVVPEPYAVRLGMRSYIVFVEQEGKEQRPFVPDVRVTSPAGPAGATTQTAVAEPATEADQQAVTIDAFLAEEYRESFVEIIEPKEQRLVTCIEVLSPSNKRRGSEGWEQYMRKRQAILLGSANLIEIDLLRSGAKFPMRGNWPNSPYTLLVCRQPSAPRCRVWPAHYRHPLPTLPVPLRSPDPDLSLDMQATVSAILSRSRYFEIDYRKPLDPPLPPADAAWLAEALQAQDAKP